MKLTVGTRNIDTDGFSLDQLIEVVDSTENGQNLADNYIITADPVERIFLHISV